ncbi:hypothetical protein ABZ865_10740 [Streptomyces sp. NPDC047085]|uniref:hypothetical protein n=1 Tax=Streptomyces sp. NPDC047085 TaxID=3155140 RepID=UPI00340094D2
MRTEPSDLPGLLGRRPGAGRRPADGGSTTAHDLSVRRRLLLTLSALLTLALFLSYEGVHGDANPLRTSSAPAVIALDTALSELDQAQRDATGAVPSISGFQTHVSVAAQSLAVAAGDDVGGSAGRQALQTVAGLITGYTGMVQKAHVEPEDSLLREAYLSYATSMLTAKGAGILPRLRHLQEEQQSVMKRQASFGRLLWFGWSATALLLLALTAALTETQLFLRRRFRRRYNWRLLGAAVLSVGGFVLLALFTWYTHRGMAGTAGRLDGPLTGQAITRAGHDTASYLKHTGFRAAASAWIVIGGVLLMALAESGLRRHINDYRFRPR